MTIPAQPKPAVVIAARRDTGDWADVELCVQSVLAYSRWPVVVAWAGPHPPELPDAAVSVEQPPGTATFGDAFRFATSVAADLGYDEWVVCNDDVVWRPDTAELLVQDVEGLRAAGRHAGFVACRTNYARPAQRALEPGTHIAQLETVSPIVAWVTADAVEAMGGWPACNWFSDDLMCWRGRQQGLTHWLSRAYVHHIGERASRQHGETVEQLATEGIEWVAENAPEFLPELRRPRARKPTMAIAFCSSGQVEAEFAKSLGVQLLADRAEQVVHTFMLSMTGPALGAARSNVVRDFLPMGIDYLLWADTDMEWAPDAPYRLLDAAVTSNIPVVGGLCFCTGRSSGEVFPTIFQLRDDGSGRYAALLNYPEDTLVRCEATGSAFVLWRRDVLEHIGRVYGAKPVVDPAVLEHRGYQLLGPDGQPVGDIPTIENDQAWYEECHDLVTGDWHSEDVTACKRARQLGYDVAVHTGVKIRHKKALFIDEDFYRSLWPDDLPRQSEVPA